MLASSILSIPLGLELMESSVWRSMTWEEGKVSIERNKNLISSLLCVLCQDRNTTAEFFFYLRLALNSSGTCWLKARRLVFVFSKAKGTLLAHAQVWKKKGKRKGGVMSPLSSSLPYIRVSLRGCCLRSQPVVMEICSSEETSAGPSCSLLLRAGQTSNSGEIVQLLRCRGVFPALQLEQEKSRAITGPRHLTGTEHAAWRLPLGVSEPKHSSGVIRRSVMKSQIADISLVYIIFPPSDSETNSECRSLQDNLVSTDVCVMVPGL